MNPTKTVNNSYSDAGSPDHTLMQMAAAHMKTMSPKLAPSSQEATEDPMAAQEVWLPRATSLYPLPPPLPRGPRE